MMWNGACPFLNGGGFGAWGWIGMALQLLLWVGLLVGLVALALWFVRRAGAGSPAPVGAASAQEIARVRYARGEITREEYQNLMDDLH